MNHFNLPSDPTVAREVVTAQAQADKAKLDRGIVGIILGTKDHVPNNVAGLIVVIGFGIIAYLALISVTWASIKDQVSGLGTFITLALGYLFGRASKD